MATRRRGLANWADADSQYLAREGIPAGQRALRRSDDTLFDATLQDGTIRDWAPDLLKGDPKTGDVIRQEQARRKTTRAMRFFIRVTPGVASILTGIAPITDQSVVTLHNISEDTLFTVAHNSPDSSDGFRILMPSNLDFDLQPNGAIQLRYDWTSKAYRPITTTALSTDTIINVTNVAGDVLTTVINNINTTIINIENEIDALGWPGVLEIDRNTGNALLGGHDPNINTGDRLEFGNTLTHPLLGNITTDDDLLVYGLEALPSVADLHILSFNRGLNTVALGNTLNLGQLNLLADGNIYAEAETGTYDTISGTDTTNTVGNDWQVNLGNNATWTTAEGNILAWDTISETFTVGTLAADVVDSLHLYADNFAHLYSNLTTLVQGDAATPTAVELRALNGDVLSRAGLATRIMSAMTWENYITTTQTGTVNDWDLTDQENSVVVRWTGVSDLTVTGLANGRRGVVVVIINDSTEADIYLFHNDSGSAEANQFELPRNQDLRIRTNEAAVLWYDDAHATPNWHAIATSTIGGTGAGGLTWADVLLNGRISGATNPQVNTGQRLELGGGTHPTLGNVTTDDDLLIYGLDIAGTTDTALLAYNRGVGLLNLGDPTSINLLQVFSSGDASINAGSDILLDATADLDIQAVDVLSTSSTFSVVAGAITLGTTGTSTITLAAPEASGTIQLQAAGTGGELNVQAETIVLNAFTGFLRADAGVVSTALIGGGDVTAADFDWEDTLARGRTTGANNPLIATGQYIEYEGPETVPTVGTHRYRGDASAASRTGADAQRTLWTYDATTDVLSWGSTGSGPAAVTVASAGLLSLDALGNIVATAVGNITADAVDIDLDATGDLTGDAVGIVFTSTTHDVIASAINIGDATTSTLSLEALDTGGQIQIYADDVLDVQAGIASVVSLDHILLDAANHIRIQGGLRLENNVEVTVSGTIHDWAPATFGDVVHLKVTTSADTTITGLASGLEGKVIFIDHVAGNHDLLLPKENVGSLEQNRWLFNPSAINVRLDDSIIVSYDSEAASGVGRWRANARALNANNEAPPWDAVLAAGRASDGTDPLVSTGDYIEFEGASAVPASGDLRAAKNAFDITARNVTDTADVSLLDFGTTTLVVGDSVDLSTLSLVASSLVSLTSPTINVGTTTTTDLNLGNTGATVDVAGSAVSLQPTGNLVLKAFTGVLRADSGVVSVDSDVSDLVSKSWADVLAVDNNSGANSPIIDDGQDLHFDGASTIRFNGAGTPGAATAQIRGGNAFRIGARTVGGTAVTLWDWASDEMLFGSTNVNALNLVSSTGGIGIRPVGGTLALGRTIGGTVAASAVVLDATGDVSALNDGNFVANPTGNVQLKTFTGLLRADSGIVSVDSDVSDLVTKTWADVLAAGRSSGANNPLINDNQYLEFDGGGTTPASGDIRMSGETFSVRARQTGDSADAALLFWSGGTLTLGSPSTPACNLSGGTIDIGSSSTTSVTIDPSAAGADVTIDPADRVDILGESILLQPNASTAIYGADVFIGNGSTNLVEFANAGNWNVFAQGAIQLGSASGTDSITALTAGFCTITPTLQLRLGHNGSAAVSSTFTLGATGNGFVIPEGTLNLGDATLTDAIVAAAAGDIAIVAGDDVQIYTAAVAGAQIWMGNGTSTSLTATPVTEDIVLKATDDIFVLADDDILIGMTASATPYSQNVYIGCTVDMNVFPGGNLNLGDSGTDNVNIDTAGIITIGSDANTDSIIAHTAGSFVFSAVAGHDFQTGNFRWSSTVTNTSTGTQNAWAPSSVANTIRWTGGSAMTLNGISAGNAAGQWMIVFNANATGGSAITVNHDSGSASAANRILMANGAAATVAAHNWLLLWYDTTSSRWRGKALSSSG